MGVPDQAHVLHLQDSPIRLGDIDITVAQESPKRVQSLRLDQLRGVKRLIERPRKLAGDRLEYLWAAEQELDQNRRVNDDQRASRSSRTSGATGGPL